MKRQAFTEDDVKLAVADERLLACIDAYRKSIVSYPILVCRYSGNRAEENLLGLSLSASMSLAIQIGLRIIAGKVLLPKDIQDRFPDCYLPMSGDEAMPL